MKIIITLVATLLVTGLGYAQFDPWLYEFPWYLNHIEVDGVVYYAPVNDEVPFITLEFSESSPNFLTTICNNGFGDIEAVEPFESFRFPDGLTVTLAECQDPDNVIFEDLYFNQFYLANTEEPFEYGIYIIDSEIPTYGLAIWWGENNWANYYDKVVLDVPTNELVSVAVFPNPVAETLHFRFLNEITFPITVSIVDTSGRLFVTETLEQVVGGHQMNVQEVPSGLYFVQIRDREGNETVKKIVK